MIDASVIEKYLQGNSLAKLSEEYNTSAYLIKKFLLSNKIHIRSRDEQNKYSPQNQRIYSINDSYFMKQSSNMAYLLGFYAADGCVYAKDNAIKLTLASVDREFLETIRKELGAQAPIQDYVTKDGYENSTLKFSSYQIKQDFTRYNIIPNKTYSFTFPLRLQPQYYRDFIRGYFDGDGSISTAGSSKLRWQVCSHEKDVLEKIVEFFYGHGIERVSIQKYSAKNLYYIQYSTTSARKIYDVLYYQNCLCLPRKYEKFQSLMK